MQEHAAEDPPVEEAVTLGDDFVAPRASEESHAASGIDPDDLERFERKRRDEAARMDLMRSDLDEEDEALGRQRRENVRVDVQIPLMIRMSGRDAPGRTRDVSATGVGFSTRLPVEMDQRGEVTIEFGDWNFTKAVVIRFIKPILAGSLIGAQFERLTDDERERLVKRVFDVQRSQLNAGKKT
ncbi:MAG: PilZ domain-containing protein [Thermoleophilia bacterium]|nr:PilZ domain-containing protein [Thermoleophilia bacterium]